MIKGYDANSTFIELQSVLSEYKENKFNRELQEYLIPLKPPMAYIHETSDEEDLNSHFDKVNDKYIIDKSEVKLEDGLAVGEGNFGSV